MTFTVAVCSFSFYDDNLIEINVEYAEFFTFIALKFCCQFKFFVLEFVGKIVTAHDFSN